MAQPRGKLDVKSCKIFHIFFTSAKIFHIKIPFFTNFHSNMRSFEPKFPSFERHFWVFLTEKLTPFHLFHILFEQIFHIFHVLLLPKIVHSNTFRPLNFSKTSKNGPENDQFLPSDHTKYHFPCVLQGLKAPQKVKYNEEFYDLCFKIISLDEYYNKFSMNKSQYY